MVSFKYDDVKNNFLASKSTDIDSQLPTHNDFLQLVITNEMEGEFVDLLEEVKDILERDYLYEDGDDVMEENNSFYCNKLKEEPPETTTDFNSNSFLYAGYADCMEEAIRFLVEEENISPEHPIVKNLKSHLEKSKDRILEKYTMREESGDFWELDGDSEMNDLFFETFQNCRDSG